MPRNRARIGKVEFLSMKQPKARKAILSVKINASDRETRLVTFDKGGYVLKCYKGAKAHGIAQQLSCPVEMITSLAKGVKKRAYG